MAREIVVTGASRGLVPGRTGMQVVMRSKGMSDATCAALERLAGYPDKWSGRTGGPDRHLYSIISVNASPVWIFGRVVDAGAGYDGRSNHLAHLVTLDGDEIEGLRESSPTTVVSELRRRFGRIWSEEPGERPAFPPPPAAPVHGSACTLWKERMDDAGWGGAVAAALMEDRPVVVIAPEATVGWSDILLGLFAESLALMPAERRWRTTFDTCALAGSTSSLQGWYATGDLLRHSAGLVVDLGHPEPIPVAYATSPLVAAARGSSSATASPTPEDKGGRSPSQGKPRGRPPPLPKKPSPEQVVLGRQPRRRDEINTTTSGDPHGREPVRRFLAALVPLIGLGVIVTAVTCGPGLIRRWQAPSAPQAPGSDSPNDSSDEVDGRHDEREPARQEAVAEGGGAEQGDASRHAVAPEEQQAGTPSIPAQAATVTPEAPGQPVRPEDNVAGPAEMVDRAADSASSAAAPTAIPQADRVVVDPATPWQRFTDALENFTPAPAPGEPVGEVSLVLASVPPPDGMEIELGTLDGYQPRAVRLPPPGKGWKLLPPAGDNDEPWAKLEITGTGLTATVYRSEPLNWYTPFRFIQGTDETDRLWLIEASHGEFKQPKQMAKDQQKTDSRATFRVDQPRQVPKRAAKSSPRYECRPIAVSDHVSVRVKEGQPRTWSFTAVYGGDETFPVTYTLEVGQTGTSTTSRTLPPLPEGNSKTRYERQGWYEFAKERVEKGDWEVIHVDPTSIRPDDNKKATRPLPEPSPKHQKNQERFVASEWLDVTARYVLEGTNDFAGWYQERFDAADEIAPAPDGDVVLAFLGSERGKEWLSKVNRPANDKTAAAGRSEADRADDQNLLFALCVLRCVPQHPNFTDLRDGMFLRRQNVCMTIQKKENTLTGLPFDLEITRGYKWTMQDKDSVLVPMQRFRSRKGAPE